MWYYSLIILSILMYISKGVRLWLVLSALIVIFDASYVLLRPHSLKGGKYQSLYGPYQKYIQFDTLYGDNQDRFVVIQSWLNLVEVAMVLVAVVLQLSASKCSKITGAFLAIIASAFVFWKTVIYVWYGHDDLTEDAKNYTVQSLFVFYLPTSFWLICPLWTIFSVGKRICAEVAKNLSEKVAGKEKKA